MWSSRSPAMCRYGALVLSALALSCEQNPPVAPPGDHPSSPGGAATPSIRFEQDRPELEIDLPDSIRAIDTSDVALIDAVKASGGRVFIALKEAEAAKLRDASFQGAVGRRARISPISAAAAEAARASLESRGVRTRRAFNRWGILAAEINPDSAGVLRAHVNVLFLEPVGSVIEQLPIGARRRHVSAVAGGQTVPTNITQVRAPDANLITTGDGVDVVIMDSAIEKEDDDCGPDFLHEDIDNSATEDKLIWFEVEGGISQGHCRDASGHGTAVAGVLLATNNMIGVRGVAPFVTRHHNFKVLDPTFAGGPAVGDFAEVAAALELVPDDAVVNMSFAGQFSAAVATAVADLYDNHDVVLVASAGNVPTGWGSSTVRFPATDTHVIAVSGVTPNDQRAVNVTGTGPPLCEGTGFGSSFGPEVELAASFTVFSTVLENQDTYGHACGTPSRPRTSPRRPPSSAPVGLPGRTLRFGPGSSKRPSTSGPHSSLGTDGSTRVRRLTARDEGVSRARQRLKCSKQETGRRAVWPGALGPTASSGS